MLVCNFLTFVEILLYQDEFKKKGFNITEKNKEDIYIEMIERDDEDLLNDLEKYLTLCEKLDYFNLYMHFLDCYKKGKISYSEFIEGKFRPM